jgi:hypothetical protein
MPSIAVHASKIRGFVGTLVSLLAFDLDRLSDRRKCRCLARLPPLSVSHSAEYLTVYLTPLQTSHCRCMPRTLTKAAPLQLRTVRELEIHVVLFYVMLYGDFVFVLLLEHEKGPLTLCPCRKWPCCVRLARFDGCRAGQRRDLVQHLSALSPWSTTG